MSGGSDKKPATKTTAATTATTPMQTVQPGMPGQINTLANQLAAGFGQQPADILAQLQQYYQPMSLPNYAPVTPTPATPATPTPVTPKPTPPKTRGIVGGGWGGRRERTWGN